MNPELLAAMRADDSPAGRAALKDYLEENDVPEMTDMVKVKAHLCSLLRKASDLKKHEFKDILLGGVTARINNLGNRVRVTLYIGGRRVFKMSNCVGALRDGCDKKSSDNLRLVDQTTRRLLSVVEVVT